MTRIRSVPTTLDPASFNVIADLAYQESGLTLVPQKLTMVQSRLRRRLKSLGFNDFSQYSAFVLSEAGVQERRQLICALTTNVSQFFRETHHFDEMCQSVKGHFSALKAGGRFRIWSAGCSNGQEPLSAAIALLEEMPELTQLDLRILATDIDMQVIQFARKGYYTQRQLNYVPKPLLEKYFRPCPHIGAEPTYRVDPQVTKLIRYNELNLLGKWPMKQSFDVIFCRNVVIYFDLLTQEALWPRFREILNHDGVLFLGHSERIADPKEHQFELSGPTTYKRTA